MKRLNAKILLFLTPLIFGFAITIQLRGDFSFQGIITPQKLVELQTGIENYKTEIDTITKSNIELLSTLRKYETDASLSGDPNKAMRDELSALRRMSDTADLKGPGIRIYLTDSDMVAEDGQSENYFLIHDFDILNLVNELKGAGAEAIAINGERVTALTNIVCGGPTILVDGKRHTPPFIIEGVGDPKKLEAAMNKTDSYLDLLRFAGIKVQMETPSEIIIPAYDGIEKSQYIKKAGSDK